MALQDQMQASTFIKSVHKKLREDTELFGESEAWNKHCQDEKKLNAYASAMYNLAQNHWELNYKTNSKAFSRVDWIYTFCNSYFKEGEIDKSRSREEEIADKIGLKLDNISSNFQTGIKLLDVGSCYNPLKFDKYFDVLPIDLAPATEDVLKCDFLNLKISNNYVENKSSVIDTLQSTSFDVVVFSLFLEYLPSTKQRKKACDTAYKLLRPEGILLIISPDSKHVGANAKIMKSWRFILSKMGFARIKYEKLPYLHCMAFRKSLKAEIPQRWALLQDEKKFYSQLVIPQDFATAECIVENNSSVDTLCDLDLFKQLPFNEHN